MSFWQFLQQNWPELLTHVRDHLWLVLVSIVVATTIGIPTGILLTRNKSLRGPVLGIANIMQTIPSLALFGFLIPLPFIGGIGARTAIVALVLYSLLPDYSKHGDRNTRRRRKRTRSGSGHGND